MMPSPRAIRLVAMIIVGIMSASYRRDSRRGVCVDATIPAFRHDPCAALGSFRCWRRARERADASPRRGHAATISMGHEFRGCSACRRRRAVSGRPASPRQRGTPYCWRRSRLYDDASRCRFRRGAARRSREAPPSRRRACCSLPVRTARVSGRTLPDDDKDEFVYYWRGELAGRARWRCAEVMSCRAAALTARFTPTRFCQDR